MATPSPNPHHHPLPWERVWTRGLPLVPCLCDTAWPLSLGYEPLHPFVSGSEQGTGGRCTHPTRGVFLLRVSCKTSQSDLPCKHQARIQWALAVRCHRCLLHQFFQAPFQGTLTVRRHRCLLLRCLLLHHCFCRTCRWLLLHHSFHRTCSARLPRRNLRLWWSRFLHRGLLQHLVRRYPTPNLMERQCWWHLLQHRSVHHLPVRCQLKWQQYLHLRWGTRRRRQTQLKHWHRQTRSPLI